MSDSTVSIYNFPIHVQGDTWKGLYSVTFIRQGSAIDLTNAEVRMQVRLSIDSPSVFDLSTNGNSGINFIEPLSAGIITIPPQVVNIPIGNYKYDLKIIYPDGYIKTYFKGLFPVISHFTR
jgi:hypothetical protein